jgi:alginate O-acetyltransferase complex protein AlgI
VALSLAFRCQALLDERVELALTGTACQVCSASLRSSALAARTPPEHKPVESGMLFCSTEFVVFFAALLAVYWAIPARRVRVWLLLAASFFFYARWNHWLAILICVSTFVDWCLALAMDRSTGTIKRRLFLSVSLVANLGLLGYFKYANFFLESFYDAMGWWHDPQHHLLDIILPVGISFYTFEAINYMVDVYRRRIRAERNLADFMLFILFFPHLVAGPIVRARDFLPQVKRPKRFDENRLYLGVQYFLLGLFKKLAIADRMALLADPVFKAPSDFHTGAAWMGLFAYALQLYCDFSGYSDMALGTAHMLGYKLVQNFDMPYFAANITEFWNRWHISLSTWLRDYLFIPLGGSRGSAWKTGRNLVITMTLAGLWHGARWTFVVFGLLHGLMLIVHRWFRPWCQARPQLQRILQSGPGEAGRVAFTFFIFCLTLVLFRAESFTLACLLYHRLFVPGGASLSPVPAIGFWMTAGLMLACHLLHKDRAWVRPALRLPAAALGFGYAVLVGLALFLSPQGSNPFIYFQF